MGSTNDEGFAGVHRLRSTEHRRVAQTVGDGSRIDGRLGNVVFAAAAAAAANLRVGKLFNCHGVAFLWLSLIGVKGA